MLALPTWLLVIPVVGFLVFVHELGHFVTAKRFGIEVTEFGFGFPPRIFGIRYGGTLYSINWIPLGGFVKMVGEEASDDPKSFAQQSILRRAIVLSAGSLVNLVVPVVIFTVLFMLPHDTLVGGDVVISAVAPGSPAKEAGIKVGDTIVAVDGSKVFNSDQLRELIRNNLGESVQISLRRGAPIVGLGSSPEYATFEMVTVVPRPDPPTLTVVAKGADSTTQVSLAEARRYDANLEVGDTLSQGWIGVVMAVTNLRFTQTTDAIWVAFPKSLLTIYEVLAFTWSGIVDGISTQSNPGFAGPIGIAQATGEVVSEFGFSRIFFLTALISISLGVVNMLPIPALDGGRLLFVVIEWIRRGKRISARREGFLHMIGFAVLVGIIVFMSYFDVIRLLNGESLIR